MVCEIKDTERAAKLFEGWNETIIWSALQGIMGKVYTAKRDNVAIDAEICCRAAMVLLGDFCFFAGEVEEELIRWKPDWFMKDFVIMVPGDEKWAGAIEKIYGKKARKVTRYAIKKEKDIFDRVKLKKIAKAVPEGYELRMIDRALFAQCGKENWAKDLVSQYEGYEDYNHLGLGVVVLKDGVIVSGASSYSSYRGGIEIEIDTREDHRRKGLATVCGAKLILECLDRGWYPSWDAQNLWSVALAEKLGYHFSHEYDAYEIWGY